MGGFVRSSCPYIRAMGFCWIFYGAILTLQQKMADYSFSQAIGVTGIIIFPTASYVQKSDGHIFSDVVWAVSSVREIVRCTFYALYITEPSLLYRLMGRLFRTLRSDARMMGRALDITRCDLYRYGRKGSLGIVRKSWRKWAHVSPWRFHL